MTLEVFLELLKYLKKKKIFQEEVADRLGITDSYLSKVKQGSKPFSDILIKKIINEFKKELLEMGGLSLPEGSMLKEEEPETASDKMQKHLNSVKNNKQNKVVPVFGNAGAKATPQLQHGDTDWSVTDYREVTSLFDDADAILPVYDKSMMPRYNPGCELALVQDLSNGYVPGEAYVLQIKGSTIPLFKRVFHGKKKGTLLLYSDNTIKHETGPRQGEYCYPPFEIDIKEITAKFTVVGEQHRRANRPLLYKI